MSCFFINNTQGRPARARQYYNRAFDEALAQRSSESLDNDDSFEMNDDFNIPPVGDWIRPDQAQRAEPVYWSDSQPKNLTLPRLAPATPTTAARITTTSDRVPQVAPRHAVLSANASVDASHGDSSDDDFFS